MLIARNGTEPRIDASAQVAASAHLIGDVEIDAGCYIDHGVVIESGGPPIHVGESVVVFPNTVIRSVGGRNRPGFSVAIGSRTVISPQCTLTGCRIGARCYVATGVIVLPGGVVGDGTRIGVGAIVHANTHVPDAARIGMRHIAAPSGDGLLVTTDINAARRAVALSGFFDTTFGIPSTDEDSLHEHIMTILLDEVRAWKDEPLG